MIAKWRVKLLDWLLWELREKVDALRDELSTQTGRINELEQAYAADPRRAEIAKEKAEQPNHIAGFTPRSKRIATWEGQRKAAPKKG